MRRHRKRYVESRSRTLIINFELSHICANWNGRFEGLISEPSGSALDLPGQTVTISERSCAAERRWEEQKSARSRCTEDPGLRFPSVIAHRSICFRISSKWLPIKAMGCPQFEPSFCTVIRLSGPDRLWHIKKFDGLQLGRHTDYKTLGNF
jgi:hypothetical protein